MTAPMRIVALTPEALTARRCLETAWAAANAVSAELEVFHVKVDPAKLRNGDEEVALQRMRVRQEGTAEARAQAVRAVYAAWRDDLPAEAAARVSWREAIGPEEASVVAETRHFDLVALPRPHNLDGNDAQHAAFRMSHRPLLFVPDRIEAHGAFAATMVIGWKPTAQAHRAVEGAGAWLRRADRVSAVMVASDMERGGAEAMERLARQLGVEVALVLVEPNEHGVDAQLLDTIHKLGADAAVLGAYQHTDVVEWVMHSTTRFMLAHADLPLFMAH